VVVKRDTASDGIAAGEGRMVGTYDVGADLLAGDLVVDDHLEGLGM
jgi:hypothetical protein